MSEVKNRIRLVWESWNRSKPASRNDWRRSDPRTLSGGYPSATSLRTSVPTIQIVKMDGKHCQYPEHSLVVKVDGNVLQHPRSRNVFLPNLPASTTVGYIGLFDIMRLTKWTARIHGYACCALHHTLKFYTGYQIL